MRESLLLLLLILLVSSLSPDEPIRPGDAILNTGQIPLGIDSLLILYPQGDYLNFGGIFVMQTQLTESDGANFFNRAEYFFAMDGMIVHVDSFVVAQSSLLPLYRRSEGPEGVISLEFDRLIEPAFYANSMDLILASLPLTKGFQAQIVISDGELEWIASVQVVGQTTVDPVMGEECRTWKINVDSRESSGEYWLSTVDRKLVRYVPVEQDMILLRLTGCTVDV